MNYRDIFNIDATLVANDFLENYMPRANGEYVKVYLYLLKHRDKTVLPEEIAEKLRLTEGDVKRALNYWKEQGILLDRAGNEEGAENKASEEASEPSEKEAYEDSASKDDAALKGKAGSITREQQERLAADSEFQQLLMIAQKYMSKIFTPRDASVLGYLYDSLRLPADVLDYLVEYCVQGGHNDIRYIEKTGLNWASQGIRSVEAARRQTKAFDKIKEEAIKKSGMRNKRTAGRRAINRPDTDYDELVMEQSFLRRIE